MSKFQVASTIKSVKTLADKSIKISVVTQELTGEQMAELFKLHDKYGYFLFSESAMTDTDVPEAPVEFKSDKSPSQRLRSVLFVYWEKNTSKSKPFDEFYKAWMNKKIEEIKDTLPE